VVASAFEATVEFPQEPAKRIMLADEVYENLTSLIMDGSIAPGVRLNIEEIARRLQVSPTPVRESLARLEADGLVDKQALKGYWTTDLLSERELVELYELRLLLEPHSAEQAALRISREESAGLRDEIATIRSAPTGSTFDSYRSFTSHDVRLHTMLFTIAGNQAIQRAFDRTHCHLHIFRLGYLPSFGDPALFEHQQIADAIIRGDASVARAAMRSHLEAAMARTLTLFDSKANDLR
jgi:DNA-binding GntR family transcriptional regulator